MSNNVLNAFDSTNCSGCMACVNACPVEALYCNKGDYGFIIPGIRTEKCTNCGKCLTVCPYHAKIVKHEPLQAYAALNKRNQTVMNSSSGGVFSALAETILAKGGYVFGAAMDDKFRVHHIEIHVESELYRLQKSKYVQSDMAYTYRCVKERLNAGAPVLFTGTPCQVAGLRGYLGDVEYDSLFCADVVCHGVPSQEFFHDYLTCLQKRYGTIRQYTFRAKKAARNGMNWFFSFQTKKTRIKNWPEDSYNYLYMKALIYRESCYTCPFATRERASDLTMCDYWGWERYHSADFKSSSTVSGCIINTDKGRCLFDESKHSLTYVTTEYQNITKHNKCLVSATARSSKREEMLKNWEHDGYESIDKAFEMVHRKQILKYRLMRYIPERMRQMVIRLAHTISTDRSSLHK